MIKLNLQVEGVEDACNWLGQLPTRVRLQLLAVMPQIVADLASATQTRAPRHTGKLADSIRGRVQEAPSGVVGTVSVGAWYSRMVEGGVNAEVRVRPYARQTGAHSVAAVKSYTRHLVIPPRPFLVPTLNAQKKSIEERISAALEAASE